MIRILVSLIFWIERTVNKGAELKASVTLLFSRPFECSFENKLKLDLLKEVLKIRLLERSREDEIGVYSPSLRTATNKNHKRRFKLSVSFGCPPQNVEKLKASAVDEIRLLRTQGPLQVNIDKFRTENQRTVETKLTTNGFLLIYLTVQLQNGGDLHQVDSCTKQHKPFCFKSNIKPIFKW